MSARVLSRIAAALSVLLALPSLAYPLGPDQSVFLVIGRSIRAGLLPYVDVVDIKPPLIFALYALTPTPLAVRVLDLAIVLAMARLVRELARVLLPREPAPPLGLAWLLTLGLYFGAFDYWCTAQVETAQSTLALLALVLAARSRPGLAGLAAAASMAFKPSILAVLPALVVWLPRAPSAASSVRSRLSATLRFGLAASIGLAVVALPFALRAGSGARVAEVLDYLRIYAKDDFGLAFSINGKRTGRFVTGFFVLLAVAVWRARNEDRARVRALGLAVSLVAVASLNVVAQHKFLNYHWAVLTPFVATAMLLAVRGFRRPGAQYTLALVWVVVGILPTRLEATARSNYHRAYARHLVETARSLPRGEHPSWDLYWGGFGNDVGPLVRASERIALEAAPGDTLCVRGFRPLPYVLTGLSCPSRFPWECHLGIESDRTELPPELPATDVRARWTNEYRGALAAHPPTFVLTYPDWPVDVERLQGLGYVEIQREESVSLWRSKLKP